MRTTLAALAILCIATTAQAQAKWRLAGNFATEHSSSVAMNQFRDELAKTSGGQLTVDVFPAMQLGGRHVTNSKRPIKSVEDLKGLKIRMQPNETHLATFRALGANPVAMDIKELYSALQQGVVDGQENPFSVINASRYFEVQKFVSNTGHFFDFINVVANKRAFEALPAAQQQALRGSMAKAVAWQRSRAAAEETESIAEIKKRGMAFEDVTPAFREQMRKASAGIVDDRK